MAKQIIRLTENDIIRLVKKVINENDDIMEQAQSPNTRQSNLMTVIKSLKKVNRPTFVIVNPASKSNNKTWEDFIREYKITWDEANLAYKTAQKLGIPLPAFSDIMYGTGMDKPDPNK